MGEDLFRAAILVKVWGGKGSQTGHLKSDYDTHLHKSWNRKAMQLLKYAEWLFTPEGYLVPGLYVLIGAALAITPFYFRRHFANDISKVIVGAMVIGGLLLIVFGVYLLVTNKPRKPDTPTPSVSTRQLEFRYSTIDVVAVDRTNPTGVGDATAKIVIKNLTSDTLKLAVIDALPGGNSYGTLVIDGISSSMPQPGGDIRPSHVTYPNQIGAGCQEFARDFRSLEPGEDGTVTMRFRVDLRGHNPKSGSVQAQLLVLNTRTKECAQKGFPDATIPVSIETQ